MTHTLAPVECTNWALSAWNSTLYRNNVASAWLYGQGHLWATSHLVSSPYLLSYNYAAMIASIKSIVTHRVSYVCVFKIIKLDVHADKTCFSQMQSQIVNNMK